MTDLSKIDIKIGILSEIRNRIIVQSTNGITTPTQGRNLRGILFAENEKNNFGNDILFPSLSYPIIEEYTPIGDRIIGITQGESIAPFLKHTDTKINTYDDLQEFLDEVILNKEWLKAYLRNREDYWESVWIPDSLEKTIFQIHHHKGFAPTKDELKSFRAR